MTVIINISAVMSFDFLDPKICMRIYAMKLFNPFIAFNEMPSWMHKIAAATAFKTLCLPNIFSLNLWTHRRGQFKERFHPSFIIRNNIIIGSNHN